MDLGKQAKTLSKAQTDAVLGYLKAVASILRESRPATTGRSATVPQGRQNFRRRVRLACSAAGEGQTEVTVFLKCPRYNVAMPPPFL